MSDKPLSMLDVWNYMSKELDKSKFRYRNGYWGQMQNGVQYFDCWMNIKAVNWRVPLGVDITPHQYDYIASHKDIMPDISIYNAYNMCTSKGHISTLPKDRIVCVLTDDLGHIGVYNPKTNESIEMCGGQTQGVKRVNIDGLISTGYWTKWCDLIFYEKSYINTPTPTPTPAPTPTPEPTPTPAPSTGKYKAQCGAFTVKNNAKKRYNQLVGIGYTPTVYYDNTNYRVMAICTDNKAECNKVVSDVKSKGIPSYCNTSADIGKVVSI